MATSEQIKPNKELFLAKLNSIPLNKFLKVYSFTIFMIGVLVTTLLILSLYQPDLPIGGILPTLLLFSKYFVIFCLPSIVQTVIFIVTKSKRIVGSLIASILVQILVISIIMYVVLDWLVFDTTDQYFSEPTKTSLAISENLRNDIFIQNFNRLDAIANNALNEIDSAIEDSLRTGVILDRLREQHELSRIVLFDGRGQELITSPVSEVIALSPIDLQRINIGIQRRKIIEGKSIQQVIIQPMTTKKREDEPVGIWLELRLPEKISTDLNNISNVSKNYNKALALRKGFVETNYTIIQNTFLLILLATLYSSSLISRRLIRLDDLSLKMKEVSEMPIPTGKVTADGKDEIAEVSISFNNLLEKISEAITKEKQTRENLQLIQDTIDAGVMVLDGSNRIKECNNAAVELLDIKDARLTMLNQLVVQKQELEEFCKLIGETFEKFHGEINFGSKKLWVYITPDENDTTSRIIMFTDISKPLASEQRKTTLQALQFTLHSLKNPLQPLLFHTESLQKIMPSVDNEKARELLESKQKTIIHHINRINEMINLMRKSVPTDKFKPIPVDLNKTIEKFVKHSGYSKTKVDVDLDPKQPLIQYNEAELSDMLENLNTNAEQQYEMQEIEHRVTKISTVEKEDFVELIFEDTAGGVRDDIIDKIFNLHMSFKKGGQGLGLARIKMFLEIADGSISVENVEKDGSCGAKFKILFKGVKIGIPNK